MTRQPDDCVEAGRESLAARFVGSAIVAALIAVPLTLVHQGGGLRDGEALVIWQAVLTFTVPFCVVMAMPQLGWRARPSRPAFRTPPDSMTSASAGCLRAGGAATDDVLDRLDEVARVVGRLRDDGRGAGARRGAAGVTIGELSQAIDEAVALAERTADNAAEQASQFQALVDRLDRATRVELRPMPARPGEAERAGRALVPVARGRGQAGGG